MPAQGAEAQNEQRAKGVSLFIGKNLVDDGAFEVRMKWPRTVCMIACAG